VTSFRVQFDLLCVVWFAVRGPLIDAAMSRVKSLLDPSDSPEQLNVVIDAFG